MATWRANGFFSRSFVPGLALVLLLTSGTIAMVNPNFTPVNIDASAKLILAVKLKEVATDGKSLTLEKVEVIKGESSGATFKIDFTKALQEKDGQVTVNKFVEEFKKNPGEPAMLAIGASQLIHVNGVWARLSAGAAKDEWQFDKLDVGLNGTFNGGSDMLLETMRFIQKFPGTPIMPTKADVQWDSEEMVGHAEGSVSALIPVSLDGVNLSLHAVCAQGDKLWLQSKDGKFSECQSWTAKSRAAAWADFNGDGRVDCATLDATGVLKLFLQDGSGKFSGLEIKTAENLSAATTLQVIALSAGGPPGLVVGVGAKPLVLKNSGGAAPKFEAVALPDAALKDPGTAGPCLVADFTGSGNCDILQCHQNAGVLYCGHPDGSFTVDANCGAATKSSKPQRAVAADLDGDGSLDVFLVGGGAAPVLLANRGGKFCDVSGFTGEIWYHIQPGACAVAPGDFNNDTFQDVFFCYPNESCDIYYNRGFRSFAEQVTLKFEPKDVPESDKGQTAAVWADFDGDGSKDLALALSNGDVYLAKTSLGAMTKPLTIRVSVSTKTNCSAPVNVVFGRDGRNLGARVATPFGEPAILGIPQRAAYTVQWTLPGQKTVTKTIDVGTNSVDLVIGESGK